MKKRLYFLIILIVLILGASLLWIGCTSRSRDDAAYALIYQDNKLVRKVELTVDKPYQFRIDFESGYNIIEVRNGAIGVVEASCPDHLCQNMGFRDNSLLPITCLPNHLVIKIVKDNDHEIIDNVSY